MIPGEKRASRGVPQGPGEEPKDWGKLAAEQASSEVDMGQSLFTLNILVKGTFQVEIPAHELVGICSLTNYIISKTYLLRYNSRTMRGPTAEDCWENFMQRSMLSDQPCAC